MTYLMLRFMPPVSTRTNDAKKLCDGWLSEWRRLVQENESAWYVLSKLSSPKIIYLLTIWLML
ncbi:hypothetical protein ASC98_17780 [Rhizobacter sp. Root1238]|nr:hypothetical protein ASC98_17780 [Rhizobacter sp. Root1238]